MTVKVPESWHKHPMGTMMAFTWMLLGLAVLIDAWAFDDFSPWPRFLWPGQDLLLPSEQFGLLLTGAMAVLGGLLFLVGHAFEKTRWNTCADFVRWTGLWFSIGTCLMMLLGIGSNLYTGMPMNGWWPVSTLIWLVYLVGHVRAIYVIKIDRLSRIGSIDRRRR